MTAAGSFLETPSLIQLRSYCCMLAMQTNRAVAQRHVYLSLSIPGGSTYCPAAHHLLNYSDPQQRHTTWRWFVRTNTHACTPSVKDIFVEIAVFSFRVQPIYDDAVNSPFQQKKPPINLHLLVLAPPAINRNIFKLNRLLSDS